MWFTLKKEGSENRIVDRTSRLTCSMVQLVQPIGPVSKTGKTWWCHNYIIINLNYIQNYIKKYFLNFCFLPVLTGLTCSYHFLAVHMTSNFLASKNLVCDRSRLNRPVPSDFKNMVKKQKFIAICIKRKYKTLKFN